MRLIMTLALALVTTTATAADLPKYFAVHVDEVADRAAYNRLDRDFVKTIRDFYALHGLSAPPVWSFTTKDGTAYGLRPRPSLSDFEKPSALGADLQKELSARTAPISEATHHTLRDHHNEIWRVESGMTTVRSKSSPKFAILRTDRVDPARADEYDSVAKAACTALSAKGVDVVAFWSIYGDGRQRYLIMSDGPIDLHLLLDKATLKRWNGGSANSTTVEVLTDPASAARWIP